MTLTPHRAAGARTAGVKLLVEVRGKERKKKVSPPLFFFCPVYMALPPMAARLFACERLCPWLCCLFLSEAPESPRSLCFRSWEELDTPNHPQIQKFKLGPDLHAVQGPHNSCPDVNGVIARAHTAVPSSATAFYRFVLPTALTSTIFFDSPHSPVFHNILGMRYLQIPVFVRQRCAALSGPLSSTTPLSYHGGHSLSRCCQPVCKEQLGNVDTLRCCLFGGGGGCGGFIEVEYTRRPRLEQGAVSSSSRHSYLRRCNLLRCRNQFSERTSIIHS